MSGFGLANMLYCMVAMYILTCFMYLENLLRVNVTTAG